MNYNLDPDVSPDKHPLVNYLLTMLIIFGIPVALALIISLIEAGRN